MPNMQDPKWEMVMPIELTAIQCLAACRSIVLALKPPENTGPLAQIARELVSLLVICLHSEGLVNLDDVREIITISRTKIS